MADNITNQSKALEQQKGFNLNFIRNRIKHGLFLLTVRNGLMRLGLDIDPIWIELESPDFCQPPVLKDDATKYSFRIIDDKTLEKEFHILGWDSDLMEKIISSDHLPMALFCEDELAAFMIARLNSYDLKGKIFTLDKNEAYLEYMYTFENFRGKRLAPYLRYQTYLLLKERGYSTFFSGTQYFNKSSLRFKKKLGAKHLEFWIHLVLLKKLRWHMRVKRYDIATN